MCILFQGPIKAFKEHTKEVFILYMYMQIFLCLVNNYWGNNKKIGTYFSNIKFVASQLANVIYHLMHQFDLLPWLQNTV